MSRPVFRLLTVAAVATAAVGLTALPALAHVTVDSPGATQGSFGVVTFRMPNELDNANATELKVQLPADQPLASVAVKPEPGWSYTITRAKLSTPIKDDDGNEISEAVSIVEFAADPGNSGIGPGQFQEFSLSVGPFPKTKSLAFSVVQSYSDGTETAWIDPTVEGQPEPEHPAPTLTLSSSSSSSSSSSDGSTAGSSSDGGSSSTGTVALVLSIVALVLGVGGVVLGLRAGRRTVSS